MCKLPSGSHQVHAGQLRVDRKGKHRARPDSLSKCSLYRDSLPLRLWLWHRDHDRGHHQPLLLLPPLRGREAQKTIA